MGPTASSGTDLTYLLPVNRDGFAIASGYLGLFSLIPNPFTSIAAIVCGVLGLHRLKHSSKLGRGRAWFGVIVGVLSVLVFAFAVVLAHASSPNARSSLGSPRHVVSEDPDAAPARASVPPTSIVDSTAACRGVLDSLGPPQRMRVDADFITLVRSYSTPSLPMPGYESVRPNLPLG